MAKVKALNLNSANVKYDNSVDTEKVYDISANVNIDNGSIRSYDAGVVLKEGMQVANFSKWGENSQSMSFQVSDVTEMCNIIAAVNTFYTDVETEVATNPIILH